jgi:hypothetical protein
MFSTSLDEFEFVLDDDDPNLPENINKEKIAKNWFTSPLWYINEVIKSTDNQSTGGDGDGDGNDPVV